MEQIKMSSLTYFSLVAIFVLLFLVGYRGIKKYDNPYTQAYYRLLYQLCGLFFGGILLVIGCYIFLPNKSTKQAAQAVINLIADKAKPLKGKEYIEYLEEISSHVEGLIEGAKEDEANK